MATHIFRVTVRGRFDGLDDATRAALVAAAPEHDNLQARFTKQGTLVYDKKADFFSFRIEARQISDDDTGAAEAEHLAGTAAMALAVAAVEQLGAGHRDLKVVATNMADVWNER